MAAHRRAAARTSGSRRSATGSVAMIQSMVSLCSCSLTNLDNAVLTASFLVVCGPRMTRARPSRSSSTSMSVLDTTSLPNIGSRTASVYLTWIYSEIGIGSTAEAARRTPRCLEVRWQTRSVVFASQPQLLPLTRSFTGSPGFTVFEPRHRGERPMDPAEPDWSEARVATDDIDNPIY